MLEAPVVMHELNAPVPRAAVVRGPAIKQLRFLAFAGAVDRVPSWVSSPPGASRSTSPLR